MDGKEWHMLEKRRGTGHNNGDNTETTFSKKAESEGVKKLGGKYNGYPLFYHTYTHWKI